MASSILSKLVITFGIALAALTAIAADLKDDDIKAAIDFIPAAVK